MSREWAFRRQGRGQTQKVEDLSQSCAAIISRVESGEKADKEPQSQEEKPEKPKKSAQKKEKKVKRAEGFQIWSELETQRTKFLVSCKQLWVLTAGVTRSKSWNKMDLIFVELPLQKLLQPALFGSVPGICHKLHSAFLQGKKKKFASQQRP